MSVHATPFLQGGDRSLVQPFPDAWLSCNPPTQLVELWVLFPGNCRADVGTQKVNGGAEPNISICHL